MTKQGNKGQEWSEDSGKRKSTSGGQRKEDERHRAVARLEGILILISERISLPSKRIGHENIKMKEWGKKKPLKEQVKGEVWKGGYVLQLRGRDMKEGKGSEWTPQNSIMTEKLDPVYRRNVMKQPDRSETLGS